MAELTNRIDVRIAETNALAAFDQHIQNGMSEPDALRATVTNYPDQAEFLSDYALNLSAVGFEGEVELSSLNSDTLAAFDRIANGSASKVRGAEGLSSLLGQANRLGIDLTSKLNLGKSVVGKLDQHLISFASIPSALIQQIASELNVQAETVRQYLAAAPKLATGASYKSSKTPRVSSRQQSFEIALNASVRSGEMSDSDRSRWLGNPGDPS